MDQSNLVSIIVPIYNGEKYLERCIKSIINQTYGNLEIILVDDGSLDTSLEICKRFKATDLRIKVIHQKNNGVTKAREKGVEQSIGDWICFVDADDYLPVDSIELLISARIPDSEIIMGSLSGKGCNQTLTIEEYRKGLITGRIFCAPFARLFKRHLFSPWIFDIPRDVKVGEDLIMNIRLAFSTKTNVIIVGEPVYKYCLNQGSISNNFINTSDYEKRLFFFLKKSIPDFYYPAYKNECIINQINAWRRLNYNKILVRKNIKSDFYKALQNEIKEADYKPSLYIKCHLSGNVVIRSILFLYQKSKEIINKVH